MLSQKEAAPISIVSNIMRHRAFHFGKHREGVGEASSLSQVACVAYAILSTKSGVRTEMPKCLAPGAFPSWNPSCIWLSERDMPWSYRSACISKHAVRLPTGVCKTQQSVSSLFQQGRQPLCYSSEGNV